MYVYIKVKWKKKFGLLIYFSGEKIVMGFRNNYVELYLKYCLFDHQWF